MKKELFKNIITLKRGYDLPNSNRIDGKYNVFTSNGISGKHNQYKVEPPVVITGRSGSLGFVQYSDERCWPHNTTLYVSDFKSNNPKYIYYLLQSLHLEKFGTGSAVPTLNRNHLDTLEIVNYSLTEQQHIVDIIGSIDDKIENNNKLIEKMYKLLNLKTNELMLDRIDSIKLEKILTEHKEKTLAEQVPYSVINTGKVVIQGEQFNKEIAKNTINKYKLIKKDYFAYNPSRINIGSIGIMNDEVGCVSPIYTVFECDKQYKFYLTQLLKFEFVKLAINKKCSGSVRQALSYNDLCSIEIPNIQKDKLIDYNNFYLKINCFIMKYENENIKLNKLKQNYLSKFF